MKETIDDKLRTDYRRGENGEDEECHHLSDDWVLNEKGEVICSKCKNYGNKY